MPFEYVTSEVAEELSNLESEFGISIKEQEIEQAGFGGQEALLIIVKFVLAGVAGGILGKFGEGIWEKLKSAVRGVLSFEKEKTQMRVVIEVKLEEDSPNNVYICSVSPVEGSNKLELFQQRLLVITQEGPPKKRLSTRQLNEYHMLQDGTWEQKSRTL